MKDHIVSAMAAEGAVRAFAAVTTTMVEEARKTHGLAPVASAALGRTLTAGAIMSRLFLKSRNDTLTIQIKGDGPLGGIIVVTDSGSNVRGYVYNPEVDLPLNEAGKLDVASAVGREGYLNIIKDLGLKQPYIGYVNLVSGEVAEDIATYFASSEQVPTAVSLGVLVGPDGGILQAGGYILQLMPGADSSLIDLLEERLAQLPPVTIMLKDGIDPEGILRSLIGLSDLKMMEQYDCSYSCNCSRDRMEKNLVSLGRQEITELMEHNKGAETHCHFCNKKYWFSEMDLRELLDSATH